MTTLPVVVSQVKSLVVTAVLVPAPEPLSIIAQKLGLFVLPAQVWVAAFATPALRNKASELATIGVKNLLELFGVLEEVRFCVAPPPLNFLLSCCYLFMWDFRVIFKPCA